MSSDVLKIGSRAQWVAATPVRGAGTMRMASPQTETVLVACDEDVKVNAGRKVVIFDYFFSLLQFRITEYLAYFTFACYSVCPVAFGLLVIMQKCVPDFSVLGSVDTLFVTDASDAESTVAIRRYLFLHFFHQVAIGSLPFYLWFKSKLDFSVTDRRARLRFLLSIFMDLMSQFSLMISLTRSVRFSELSEQQIITLVLMHFYACVELFRFGYHFSRRASVGYWLVTARSCCRLYFWYNDTAFAFDLLLLLLSFVKIRVGGVVGVKEEKSQAGRSRLAESWSKIVGFPVYHVGDSMLSMILSGFSAQTTSREEVNRLAYAGDVVLKMFLADRVLHSQWPVSVATVYSSSAFSNENMAGFMHHNDPNFTKEYGFQLLGAKNKGTIFEAMLGIAWKLGNEEERAAIEAAIGDGLIDFAFERNN